MKPHLGATSPAGLDQPIHLLTRALAPYIRRLEIRFSLSREDSEDMVQEALLAFIMHRAKVEDPVRWFFSVLRNECLRVLRRRCLRYVSIGDLRAGELVRLSAVPPKDVVAQVALEKVLAGLSPRNQRVLWMRFVSGESWIEIAEALKCKPSGAKKAVFRAVSAARESASSL